jgi:hypothetical protein
MEAESPKADPPKRKRRWFQFSLRTLMIGVTIATFACAWLAREVRAFSSARVCDNGLRKAAAPASS